LIEPSTNLLFTRSSYLSVCLSASVAEQFNNMGFDQVSVTTCVSVCLSVCLVFMRQCLAYHRF